MAAVKKETKTPEKKATPAKPVAKAETKKAEAKPAPKKAPAKKVEEPKKESSKAYHVSQHKDGYKVKAAGSDKALKVFKTQKEAIDHAKKVAKNQDGHAVVHSKQGKIRKA